MQPASTFEGFKIRPNTLAHHYNTIYYMCSLYVPDGRYGGPTGPASWPRGDCCCRDE